jgi:hypothetical protein
MFCHEKLLSHVFLFVRQLMMGFGCFNKFDNMKSNATEDEYICYFYDDGKVPRVFKI